MGNAKNNEGAAQEKLWTLSFVLITCISLLSSLNGNGISNGIAVLVEMGNLPATLVGEVTFAFSIAALAARFVAGHLSDKKGRRLVVELGVALLAAGCIFALLFENLYWLIPARTLMGFGFSMIATSCAAAVADVVPRSRMGEGLGYQGLAQALSMAVGPSFAMFLAGQGGRLWLFGGFLILAIVGFILARICPFGTTPQNNQDEADGAREPAAIQGKQNIPASASSQKGFLNRTLWVLLEKAAVPSAVVVMVSSIPQSLFINFTSLTALERGLSGAGLFFIASAVVMLLVRVTCAKMFDKPWAGDLLIVASLCGIVGLLVILYAQGPWAFVLAGILNGIGGAMTQPILMAEAMRRAPDDRRGSASATFYVGCDIAMGFGSLLWGVTIEYFGYSLSYFGGCLFFVINIALYWILIRKHK